MITDAATYTDEDKKVKECVHAEKAFDGYLHSIQSATEGSGENTRLNEKMEDEEEEEKEKVIDATKEGHQWMDSDSEADVEEIKEKHEALELEEEEEEEEGL